MKVFVIVSLCLLFLRSCHDVNGDMEMNTDDQGIAVKVLGQSGKVMIGKTNDSSRVTMEMDKIAEYSSNGTTEVGKSGQVKHSFNTFASQEFTFSDPKREKYQDIDTHSFNFTSQINDATLTVRITIFEADGTVVNDNEEMNVTKGMVKTDITISNWLFCNPCSQGGIDEFGENLQFTITIKGKNDGPKKKADGNSSRIGRVKPDKYDLGDDVSLMISKKYKDNDVWKDMASGYPKLVNDGSKQSFVFRFEKFNGTVFYDPTVDAAGTGTDITTTPAVVTTDSAGTGTGSINSTSTAIVTGIVNGTGNGNGTTTPASGGAVVKDSAFSMILMLFFTLAVVY